ncbi:hypothetical protein Leryth_012769 [Lithospermum erythrorhizon]|nr:hypothetical protein Leryth_012769 [Lithospermum erythrorhizon]
MYGCDKEAFRLLCNLHTAGAIIGSDGHLIDTIRRQTHTRICISLPIPSSQERLITIFGDTRITNKLILTQKPNQNHTRGTNKVVITQQPNKNETHKPQNYTRGINEVVITQEHKKNEEEVEEIVCVSNAQKALLMVFEKILEVEGVDEVESCRFLVRDGKMRYVVGKGGWVVKNIETRYRVCIRGFKEFLPACALPGDELIQITGNGFALKKAMLEVSHRLQPNPTWPNENPELLANYNQRAPLSCGVASAVATNDLPMRLELDRNLNLKGKSFKRQVVFRLLCPYDTAGGVIGRNAEIVKVMEHETGASIRFSPQLDTPRERVATIGAIEKPDYSPSPAQVAVIRVFTRSVEVKDMDKTSSVEARLLVGPAEINCLVDDAGRISADITPASGVEIQLLGADFAPSCANDDDIVVQLTGDLAHVKETLYQITGRLRKRLFSMKVTDEEGCWQHPHSSGSSNNSNGRGTTASSVSAELSIRSSSKAHDTLGFNQKFAAHSPRLPHEVFTTCSNNAKVENEGRYFKLLMSMDTEAMKSVTVEVAVPEQSIANVYGENGNNLARLKLVNPLLPLFLFT